MSSEAQNIYENADFFSAYSTLPRSQGGLSSAPEWPVLRQMILQNSAQDPTINEERIQGSWVLDLGCGYGWFSRWARDNGVAHVRALDISEKMICRAEEFDPRGQFRKFEICYEVEDLEKVELSKKYEKFHLIYSSLTFHYIHDLARLYREIWSSLREGGRLVFSVEHPICSAPISPAPDWISVQVEEGGEEKKKIWPLNSYAEEGWRYTSWLGVSGVKKYHRTVETYVTLLLESGFKLLGLKDWVPSKEDVAEHPEWADERNRPYFLLISAEK